MKALLKLIPIVLVFFSSDVRASTESIEIQSEEEAQSKEHVDLVVQCVRRVRLEGPSVRLWVIKSPCTGVKTQAQVDLVVSCRNQVGFYRASACLGVRTKEEVKSVVQCARRVHGSEAEACSIR